jgi:hypothetical protein
MPKKGKQNLTAKQAFRSGAAGELNKYTSQNHFDDDFKPANNNEGLALQGHQMNLD